MFLRSARGDTMMMGDDDEMINFLHSLYNGISRARGKHKFAFLSLLLLFGLCFAPFTLCFENRQTLKTLHQNLVLKWKCLRFVKNVRAC
jgi:hypothetical protein